MSRPTNWRAQRNRDIVRRHGGEDRRGGMPAEFLPAPKPKPSKSAMRAEAERLVAEFLEKENAGEYAVERGE